MSFKLSILMHVPFIFSKVGVVEATPTTLVTTPLSKTLDSLVFLIIIFGQKMVNDERNEQTRYVSNR